MIAAISLQQIASATGGQLIGDDCQVSSVSTDSRTIKPGCAYLALSGERYDGHDFIADAAAKGAVAVIVSEAVQTTLPQVRVKDALLALGQIGALNRNALAGPVLALTGSCGKTTCKEMLAAILSRSRNVLATRGNFNNEIGVPLTLLNIEAEHELAIIEMGAGKPGDISYLCQFASPDLALITNVGQAHLEAFGSVEKIAETKGEIYQALNEKGTAIINADDRFADQWRARTSAGRVISVSRANRESDFYAEDIQLSARGTTFRMHCPDGEVSMKLSVLGAAMVSNALLAAAAAWAVGTSLADIAEGLASLSPVQGRLHLQALPGVTLIDDSYNANPSSVMAAIDVLACFGGRRVLVLGDMAELGPETETLHREIGIYAAQAGIDRLLSCGNLSQYSAQGAGDIATHFSSKDSLLADIQNQLMPGDSVLVKGSRSAGMEDVVNAVANTEATGENASC